MINDKDNEIKKLTNDNEVLNEIISYLDNININLDTQTEVYKQHSLVLLNLNEVLIKELHCILKKDADINYTLNHGA